MRYLLLLLLLLPGPALAQMATTTANPTQNNDNQAASQSMANQQNQSRSESIGGNMNNYQYNNSQGELGEMTVSERAVSCESGSFYMSAGAYPQDSQGFYTFDDRDRDMMYAPQANLGFQLPFGPQVASCVEAMKRQTQQIQVSTAAGTVKKCLEVKVIATKASVPMEIIAAEYPVLKDKCMAMWNINS
jgi:hypothetical protein